MRVVDRVTVFLLPFFFSLSTGCASSSFDSAGAAAYLSQDLRHKLIDYEQALSKCEQIAQNSDPLVFPLAFLQKKQLDRSQAFATVLYFVHTNHRVCLEHSDAELIYSAQLLENLDSTSANEALSKAAEALKQVVFVDENTLEALATFDALPDSLKAQLADYFLNKLLTAKQITNWDEVRAALATR